MQMKRATDGYNYKCEESFNTTSTQRVIAHKSEMETNGLTINLVVWRLRQLPSSYATNREVRCCDLGCDSSGRSVETVRC